MNLTTWLLPLIGCAILSVQGCAPISKMECLRGDWHTRGYQDGRAGRSIDQIARYSESCEKHSVNPDPIAYQNGHKIGILEFCRPEIGFRQGENNKNYSGACPAKLESDFLNAYLDGLELARENLALEFDDFQSELNQARDQRLRLQTGDVKGKKKLDSTIEILESRSQSNTDERRDINNRITRWHGRL